MSNPQFVFFRIANRGQIQEVAKPFQEGFVIGRRSSAGGMRNNDLFIDDPYSSRRHCKLFIGDDDQWWVEDLGSSNGTRLNGDQLIRPVRYPANGVIQIGETRITIDFVAATGTDDYEGGDGDPITSLTPGEIEDWDDREPLTILKKAAPELTSPGLEVRDGSGRLGEPVPSRRRSSPEPGEGATLAASAMANKPVPADHAEHSTVVARPGGNDATVAAPRGDEDATVSALQGGQDATVSAIRGDLGATVTELEAIGRAAISKAHTISDYAIDDAGDPASAEMIQELSSLDTADVVDLFKERRTAATATAGGSGSPGTQTGFSLGSQGGANPDQTLPPEDGFPSSEAWQRDLEEFALSSNLVRGLIKNGFLVKEEMGSYLREVRKHHKTLFRVVWESKTIEEEQERLFRWVSQSQGLELWDDDYRLGEQAVPNSWLGYKRGLALGAVLLNDSKASANCRYATLDPFDLDIRYQIERCEKRPSVPVMVLPRIFNRTMKGLAEQDTKPAEAGSVIDFSLELIAHYREHLSEVGVPEMINFFLFRSYRRNASDIHIEPTDDALVVRNRVDGILHEEFVLPSTFQKEVASRLKIMSGMDVAEKRRPQDGRFSRVIFNSPIDVRVSSYPTVFGEKFVLRLLDKSALRPSIEKLNLLARDLVILKEKVAAPYGLIMISGPTGSGKTTTLYSCLSSIDKGAKNVLTVEDPVEYRLNGVHQMQVNSKIGLNFATGLRTILRQDPDVIMVGEIRDEETARMAVQASLTGHIVFSTIHTNDAVGVITRLLDMGIEPFLVATSLSLAVAQRLVRCICPHCRDSVPGTVVLGNLLEAGISKRRLQELDIEIDPDNYYVEGRGCRECMNTGYHGRQAVFEMFEMTSEARAAIMTPGFSAGKLSAIAKKARMTTLIEHGKKLVEDEKTTYFEVIRVLGESH